MLESFTSVGAPSVLPHLHGSKLAGLAVTQPQRSPSARDVPTLCEALGVMRDDDFVAWYVLLAPARRPPDAIAATEKAAFAMLKQAELHTKLAGLGTDPVAMPGEPFAAHARGVPPLCRDHPALWHQGAVPLQSSGRNRHRPEVGP